MDQEQKAPALPALDKGDHLTRISNDPAQARAEILKWWSAARNENAFHRIYGTQMKLLDHLAAKEPVGDVEANLEPFYAEHKKLVEAQAGAQPSPSWEAYIGFLASNGFTNTEVRDGIRYMRITQVGTDFLRYIRETWGALAATKGF
jgi:hypothetical protein